VARTTPTLPAPQHFGEPAVAELEPGDALVFRGEHLHASEINVTDETRYVLTVRFTPATPRYGEGILWRPYTDLRLAGSALAPLATLRSRLCAAWLRQRVYRTRSAIRHHVPLAGRLGV
jgi:ectoine hydroxylase-related dioxygenase (phytanoyl-CoA dioxygenase family)